MDSALQQFLRGFSQLRQHELRDRNVRSAYSVCLLTGTAYGMVTAVVAIYLNKERGYQALTIGELALFFSLGIAAFAVPMGMLIRTLSPRTMLSVALLGYGAATAVFPFMATFLGLGSARWFDGAFSVGVWVSIETILLMRTTPQNRGLATSLYSIVLACGYALGSLLARVMMVGLERPWVFVGAGLLAAIAATFALVRLDPGIRPLEGSGHVEETPAAGDSQRSSLGFGRLYWKIKTACIPTFAYGYFQASMILFLPLYLIEDRKIAEETTALLIAFYSFGMAASVVFVGRLGDHFGHLKTVRALVVAGVLLTASLVYMPSFMLIAVVVALAGGCLAPIWPLSLALQSLIADPHDYSRSNALLNGSYGLGTLAGPLASGYLFQHYGGEVTFLHIAGLWALALLATLAFRRDDPSFRAIAQARARAAAAA